MNKLTRVSSVLIGVLGVGGVCTLGPIACSSSATGLLDGSVPETGADHVTVETGPRHDSGHVDAGHDATKDVTPDVITQHDTGTDAHDGGTDAHDGGTDAHDSGPDVHDAAPEVSIDSSSSAATFPRTMVTAYCTKLSSCCGETPSQFSIDACTKALYDAPSFVPSQLALILGGLNSTEHTFDSTQGAKCITEIESLGCGSSSATTWKKIAADCAAAYTGLLEASHPGCLSSFDCQPGNYCAPLDRAGNTVVPDGGGTCTPLAGTGGHCVDILNSSDCTYLGLGTPAQYCNNVINDAGQQTDGGVCTASLSSGTACNYPGYAQECTSLQCLPTVDAGFLVQDYACTDSAGFTQIEGVPQCLLFAPDGG